MTDPQLEALFAEKVLGWSRRQPTRLFDEHESEWQDADGVEKHLRNPFTSLDDAFAGLRAHPDWAWVIVNYLVDSTGVRIDLAEGPLASASVEGPLPESLNRAIVLACLRAVGVEV